MSEVDQGGEMMIKSPKPEQFYKPDKIDYENTNDELDQDISVTPNFRALRSIQKKLNDSETKSSKSSRSKVRVEIVSNEVPNENQEREESQLIVNNTNNDTAL